jgi:hypothetical protein
LRQQLVDEETREPIDGHEKARGYEIGKGQFLLVEDEELEAIEIESTHTIDIDSFVPRSEIDQRFFDTPYYITPNEPVGQEAFAVIREAMRSNALVALGRIVLAKRERVMALEPYERGLLGTTLHYPYEVRHAKDYFADIPPTTPVKGIVHVPAHNTPMKPGRREVLMVAIAKARRWIEHGHSLADIARREGKPERYVRRIARLAFVSPRIITAIMDGTSPAGLTVTAFAAGLPYSWAEQEQRIGISPHRSIFQ